MKIMKLEKRVADELINNFLIFKNELPYANIGEKNKYKGWVNNFNLSTRSGQTIKLDLKKDNDLFLLFVLAIVWSRTGQWENSAFFVSYLIINEKDNVSYWLEDNNITLEKNNRIQSAKITSKSLTGHIPRKRISFRKDIFNSIFLLATKWDEIKVILQKSEEQKDFKIFMTYMRDIKGFGVGDRKMLIKIPLILRELRCQNIYNNISGELCCVPDARVFDAGKELNIKIPRTGNLENLILSSTKIYKLFGDLYDIPLFAYNDLKSLI